ncbi:MAG: hypothetical protein O2819_05960 [Planctomycetota bacterium]|nr:hypothetical protein [Planctomycetota bacterium]MDA1106394.1 hypothetical protein [Planctomycetota bacterium]
MRLTHHRPGSQALWIVFGTALLCSGLAYAAGRASTAPSAVANLNLLLVLEQLTQRADMEVEVSAMHRKAEDEFRKRTADLESRAKAADALPDPERQATRDDIALGQLQLREWIAMETSSLDRENALQWQNLYRSIQLEAERLAEAEGYDYVLVYDGPAPMQVDRELRQPLGQQVMEQIMRRRVLYAAKKDDITERLVIRMNNARAAAPSKSTASKEKTP